MKKKKRLGVGIIGGGFIARFHIRSWVGVRDADILGIFDPDGKRAREACDLVGTLGVGAGEALCLDHRHGRRSGHRRDLDLRPELSPAAP